MTWFGTIIIFVGLLEMAIVFSCASLALFFQYFMLASSTKQNARKSRTDDPSVADLGKIVNFKKGRDPGSTTMGSTM